MRRAIVGYTRDEEGFWVAALACGHTQHVRHRPPFVERPWVTTEEGRRSRIGWELDCVDCARSAKGGRTARSPTGDVSHPSKEEVCMGNTIRLHRVVKAPPQRVYKAFTNADALAKWLPPDGFTCRVDSLEARVGGKFRMAFTNFATGASHAFGGEYLELVPAERIRYSDKFDDPNLPGEMTVTVELRAVACGTELHVTQENVPTAIPVEMCYLGWQDSLRQLMHLVETAPA